MTDLELVKKLKRSKIFRGLSDDVLSAVSARGNQISSRPGEIIVRENQGDHPFYVILRGEVEVILPKHRNGITRERTTPIRLSRLTSGSCIGEYSLIDGQPASAAVVARTACDLFVLSRKAFGELTNASDRLARQVYLNLLRYVIERARQANKELDICF